MKILLILLFFFWTISTFGQTNLTRQKGNYFKTTSGDYFKKVIKPWKYQYTQTQINNAGDSVKKSDKLFSGEVKRFMTKFQKNIGSLTLAMTFILPQTLHM